jgi:hypothetical protein
MLLIDTSLDGEITGRIPRELTLSSLEVAIHYVELNQTHIRSLQINTQPSLYYASSLHTNASRTVDLLTESITNLCGRYVSRLDKLSPAGIKSAQV